jgi:glycosyltransferase involved in cell wall biosynthesis
MDISVIICAHNPRTAAPAKAPRRAFQADPAQGRRGLLLVDNSSEPLLAANWDLSWHPQVRYAREPKLGVAIARRSGIRAATTDLLMFADDDNVSDPDYMEEALQIALDNSEHGAAHYAGIRSGAERICKDAHA